MEENVIDYLDTSRKTITVYVVAFLPGRCKGMMGGFDWYMSPSGAIDALLVQLKEDENLESDYVLRSVQVPVVHATSNQAVTDWLDGEGSELWNIVSSGES